MRTRSTHDSARHSLARSLFLLRARNSQAVKQQASGKRAALTQARCMYAEVGVERTQQWGGYAMRYREWRGGGLQGKRDPLLLRSGLPPNRAATAYRPVEMAVPFYSKKLAISWRAKPPKIVGLAGAIADSLPRFSGSSLDEGQDIRNLHLPEVAAAPSNFVLDLPRIADFERLKSPGGSWLFREKKKKRKRAKRRAAEFKELRENGVNKIFPLVHVKARPHKHAQSKEGKIDETLGWDPGEKERGNLQKHPVAPCTKGEMRESGAAMERETRGGRGRSGPFEGRERVDETKETRQGGGGAEKAGEKGGGCRGMRPWSRYIRAPVPAYARVFVYLCGTPENSADNKRNASDWYVRECRQCDSGDFGRERMSRARPVPLPYSTRTASRRIVSAALFSRRNTLVSHVSLPFYFVPRDVGGPSTRRFTASPGGLRPFSQITNSFTTDDNDDDSSSANRYSQGFSFLHCRSHLRKTHLAGGVFGINVAAGVPACRDQDNDLVSLSDSPSSSDLR
ncbi:hypothetical protein ALC53_13857 [Atta colombica]|uniref:Uncharacterized protein n=1 Tax=Atta colombica TaxID=520822 RepID=A0A195AU81_9HYME|nr:hypothetical protein ALC53_13857 [Atta colombica]